MSRSGEKHAQDYNLILCILMALRATYFLSVIYGDPVFSIRSQLLVQQSLNSEAEKIWENLRKLEKLYEMSCGFSYHVIIVNKNHELAK